MAGVMSTVAVEQRRAEDAKPDDDASSALQGAFGHDHRGEGQNSALSVVVGLHHEGQVLDGDDDHEGPEGQRCHAEGVHGVRGVEVLMLERLAERVQRRGADVAVHDPQRPERECSGAHGMTGVTVMTLATDRCGTG